MMHVHQEYLWLEKIFHNYTWLVEVCIVLFIAALLSIIQRFIYSHIIPRLKRTHKLWDDALVDSLHNPLTFLIWLLAITYSGDIAKEAAKTWAILDATDSIRRIGLIIFFAWFLGRFIKKIGERIVDPNYKKRPRDKTTVDAVIKLSLLSLGLIVLLLSLQEFGVSLSAVIAFGGGSALVVGFAAKDLLANFFGGLMIYTDRPFAVGEWIRSPDKDIEGTVEYIGWRSTRIRTFDKRPLYVPNSLFSTVAIENPSRMTNRRIKTVFGLRYADASKLADIVNDIEKMLGQHPDIDSRQTYFVKLIEFGNSALNILIYTFTKTTDWVKFQSVQQDVFLKIIDIVYNKYQAQMAFPTQTLETNVPLPIELKNFATSQMREEK